jgi:hypothetical protein
LLKILLKAQGLEVFLDVDNLANTGAFDEQLWKHLSATKNVILVWTKGCMDRFLGDEDVAQQDFVRKEYGVHFFNANGVCFLTCLSPGTGWQCS